MKNVYSRSIALTLAFYLIVHLAYAQAINQGFITPNVLRQGETRIIRQASDGKLYVYGDFNYHGDRFIGNLVRLHPDGLLDNSFTSQYLYSESQILDLEVLTNGNVVVIVRDESNRTKLQVLNANGQIIHTIDPNNASLTAVEPDTAGGFFLAAYGNVDQYSSTFNYVKRVASAVSASKNIYDIQLQSSQLVISGDFTSVRDGLDATTQSRHLIARYNLSGHLDRTFNANTAVEGLGAVQGVLVMPDGKIIPVDHHTSYYGNARPMRLNADGSLDTGFAYPFQATLAIEDAFYMDGKLTIVTNRKIARLNSDGSLDSSFRVINYNRAHVVATVLPDGAVVAGNYVPATYGFAKWTESGNRINEFYGRLMRYGTISAMDRTSTSIFIAGDFIRVGGHFTRNVARLNLNGTILTKFKSTIMEPISNIEALPNAKVLATTTTQIYRMRHDGTIDSNFSYTPASEIPYITKIVAQPDGKVLVGGRFDLIRLNANGSRDLSFDADPGVPVTPNTMEFDLDTISGKIAYINWQYPVDNGSEGTVLLRLNPDGTRDSSFNPPSFEPDSFFAYLKALFLQNGEMIVLKPGYLTGDHRYDVIRLNQDGSIDEEFADNAEGYHDYTQNIILFGNRILLSRHTATSSEDPHTMDALFLDGSPDLSFSMPLVVDRYTKYYTDNDTELFVMRNNGINPLTKITYAPAPVTNSGRVQSTAFRFYPNPVKDKVTIDVETKGTVNILDQSGMRAISVPLKEGSNEFNLDQLKAGHYIIEVITNGERQSEHLIKGL